MGQFVPTSQVIRQVGDGNCFFRSISYAVYGDASLHGRVREEVVAWARAHRDEVAVWMGDELDDHLTAMGRLGRWGTDLEAWVCGPLYHMNVEVFGGVRERGGFTLTSFTRSAPYLTSPRRTVWLLNSPNHYDVLAVDPAPRPPSPEQEEEAVPPPPPTPPAPRQGLPEGNTFYEILGVQPNATTAQINAAYRRLAIRLHPDKGGDEEEFKLLQHIADILRDPVARAQYDLTLGIHPSEDFGAAQRERERREEAAQWERDRPQRVRDRAEEEERERARRREEEDSDPLPDEYDRRALDEAMRAFQRLQREGITQQQRAAAAAAGEVLEHVMMDIDDVSELEPQHPEMKWTGAGSKRKPSSRLTTTS